jgi:hypothetical protein
MTAKISRNRDFLKIFRDFLKIFQKKFGGKEKMSTFAIPNENNTFENKFWCHSSVGRAKD